MAILTRGDVRATCTRNSTTRSKALQRFQSQPAGRSASVWKNLISQPGHSEPRGSLGCRRHPVLPAAAERLRVPEFDQASQRDSRRHLRIRPAGVQPLVAAALRAATTRHVTAGSALFGRSVRRRHRSAVADPGECAAAGQVAINGMYQHSMQKDASCRLLRVSLPDGGASCIRKSAAASTGLRCVSSNGQRSTVVPCRRARRIEFRISIC